MSVKCIPTYTPLLYNKNWVYRGIPIFLILVQDVYSGYTLEPRLGEAVVTRTHNLYFGAKIRKIGIPPYPSFAIIKVGFKGPVYISRTWFSLLQQ